MEKKDKRLKGARCVVESCCTNNRNKNSLQLRLFKFPKDKIRKSKWISACKIIDYGKQMYICEKHFCVRFLGKKKLKNNAIPSLFLDDNFPTTSEPIRLVDNFSYVSISCSN